MLELTVEEKEVLKKIFSELEKCKLFTGEYDAKHGQESFMYGINTVMEVLAYSVSDEFGREFCDKFINNMIKSEECVL